MGTRICRGLFLLLTAAALPGVRAGEADPHESVGRVPLYTNADLEALGPSPSSSSPGSEAHAEPGWSFVLAFLDRQYARLDAERRLDLERKALERMAEPTERPSYVAPYLGVYGFHALALRHPGKKRPRRVPPERDRHGSGPPLREFLSGRETIHARPPADRVGHGAASGLSGKDAFPLRHPAKARED